MIESFKSTLDEVAESDILLHVVDFSHPLYQEQIEVVNQTLSELRAAEKPQVIVYNKIDSIPPDEGEESSDISEQIEAGRIMNNDQDYSVYISATKKINIDELKQVMFNKVKEHHLKIYPNYLAPSEFRRGVRPLHPATS